MALMETRSGCAWQGGLILQLLRVNVALIDSMAGRQECCSCWGAQERLLSRPWCSCCV